MLNESISDVSLNDEVSFVISKWQQRFKSVDRVELSLIRKADKFTRKHFHECVGNAEVAKNHSAGFSYETLNEEMTYVYFQILQPLQKYFTNVDDTSSIIATVQQDGSLDSSIHADLTIVIPNKKEWISYVALKYRKLTKFAEYIQSMHYEVVNHKIRRIKISMLLDMSFNMVKHMKECTENEQFFNNWISSCHVIENYTKEHTSNIYVDIKDNNMHIQYKSMKVKYSQIVEL
ncbi:hypothetical protein ACMHYP_22895 [Bacillus cereus]|uniref:hypothetical protein n=1 Tax=Bacillus cereus group TaxID=86661 RepID=UPI0011C91122|nr:hypothetical protein [Bacillus sp. AR18-7]TXR64547.1 hypothetical protein DN395_11470 [Bacillus sp. AR18-7]